MKQLEESKQIKKDDTDGTLHDRVNVREALTMYMWPKMIIDPKHPTNGLYDVEHEHRKEVWGHKCVKDFMLRAGKKEFTMGEMKKWFEATEKPAGSQLKQPQVGGSMQLLDFCNSLIVAQVNYVLDTIE